MAIKNLDREIEELRKLMIDTAAKYNWQYSHPDVVECSQELDKLIKAEQEQKSVAVS